VKQKRFYLIPTCAMAVGVHKDVKLNVA